MRAHVVTMGATTSKHPMAERELVGPLEVEMVDANYVALLPVDLIRNLLRFIVGELYRWMGILERMSVSRGEQYLSL